MFDNIMSMAQAAQDSNVTYGFDLFNIVAIVGLWKMFDKAGEPGWAALIPFYNVYKLCEITMDDPWYWLRLLVFCIPVVGWIAGLYFYYQMCKATALSYGKPETWTWGYFFLSGIFYCITGFDSSEYYGPMGEDDRRTTQARQSKTVNFDVIKDTPVEEYKEVIKEPKVTPVTPVEPQKEAQKEEVVDFFFDQPDE